MRRTEQIPGSPGESPAGHSVLVLAELTPPELTYLTDLDHVTHESIAAVEQSTGAIVGVARYVQQADRIGVADMAVEVADGRHNMGIGTALAEIAIQRARANGLTFLTASVLWENRPARSLLRRLGFRALASSSSVIETQLALEPDARPVGVGLQARDRASD